MDQVRFVTTGYVTKQRGGPLSITELTSSELRITEVLGKTEGIPLLLRGGKTVAEVTDRISSLRKSELTIPLDHIRSLRWLRRETGLRVDYEDDRGRNRTKTTYIQKDAEREQFIGRMEEAIGHRFQRRELPAAFWKLAWSQMLGAALSVAGTVTVELLWDPPLIAQLQHGWIVLKLGRVGCGFVGFGFFVGCLIAAWRRLHPRPFEYQCIV